MTVSFARTTSVRITVQRVSVATRNKPPPLKQVGRGARRRGVCTPFLFFFREIETESLLLLIKYRDLALLCSQSKKGKPKTKNTVTAQQQSPQLEFLKIPDRCFDAMQRWNSCSGALSKAFVFILFVFGADGRGTCRRIPFTSAHMVTAGEKTSPHCNGCGWQGHRITLNTSLGFGRFNEHIILTAGLQQGDELAGGPSRSADNTGVK